MSSTTLTLRHAYENHYVRHADLAERTREKYRSCLKLWERFSPDPDVRSVDNQTLAEFRDALVDAEFSPATINGCWKTLRTIFRLLGPQQWRNPFGLGMLDHIPAMRIVKGRRSKPYRIPLGDLGGTYCAAHAAAWPITGIPPADVWRALLVVAYTTGLRRSDLYRLTWEAIDLDEGTIEFCAGKTGKDELRVLHSVAAEHLRRIYRQTERVFHGLSFGNNGNIYKVLRKLQRKAGVKRAFNLHDIRRTGGSEVERIRPGCGRVFLQHAPRTVSDVSYLNRADELDEAILKMRLPDEFTGKLPAAELPDVPQPCEDEALVICELPIPNRGAWAFRPGAFRLSGRWFPLRNGSTCTTLKLLAKAPRPLTSDEIAGVLNRRTVREETQYARKPISNERVRVAIHEVRTALRHLLGLPDSLDPVPCVQRKPPAWSLYLPVYVTERLAKDVAWEFRPDGFRLAGQWFPVESKVELAILNLLVRSPQPLTAPEIACEAHLAEAALADLPIQSASKVSGTRVRVELGNLRTTLRRLLDLPQGRDPVCRVETMPDAWSLHIPDEVIARLRG